MNDLVVVGVADSDAVVAYLKDGDVCFGKSFAKSAPECISCRAPVVFQGRLHLMKEICAAKVLGSAGVEHINKIPARVVLERFESGASVFDVFREIVGDSTVEHTGALARQVLVDRLAYLTSIGFKAPEVPRTKVLIDETKKVVGVQGRVEVVGGSKEGRGTPPVTPTYRLPTIQSDGE